MDASAVLNALINAGGFGMMAAAIFWLHCRSIDQFREEMKEERAGFTQRNALLVAAIERQTGEIVGQFRALSQELRNYTSRGR